MSGRAFHRQEAATSAIVLRLVLGMWKRFKGIGSKGACCVLWVEKFFKVSGKGGGGLRKESLYSILMEMGRQ